MAPRYIKAHAAELAEVSPATVAAWLKRNGNNEASFTDLLGLRLARGLRREHKFTPRRAAEFVRELVERLGPLGAASATMWAEGTRRLYVVLEGGTIELGENGQHVMEPVMKHVSSQVEFNQVGEAVRWYPDGKESSVVIDPAVRWGETVIRGTRVPTWALHAAWLEMGADRAAYEAVADAYLVKTKQVEDAVRFQARRE